MTDKIEPIYDAIERFNWGNDNYIICGYTHEGRPGRCSTKASWAT
jgi:hypothetical protein